MYALAYDIALDLTLEFRRLTFQSATSATPLHECPTVLAPADSHLKQARAKLSRLNKDD